MFLGEELNFSFFIRHSYRIKMLGELMEDLRRDTSYLNTQFRQIGRLSASADLMLTKPKDYNAIKGEMWLFQGVYFVQNTKAFESIKSSRH